MYVNTCLHLVSRAATCTIHSARCRSTERLCICHVARVAERARQKTIRVGDPLMQATPQVNLSEGGQTCHQLHHTRCHIAANQIGCARSDIADAERRRNRPGSVVARQSQILVNRLVRLPTVYHTQRANRR